MGLCVLGPSAEACGEVESGGLTMRRMEKVSSGWKEHSGRRPSDAQVELPRGSLVCVGLQPRGYRGN